MKSNLHIGLDVSPLASGHAYRGIGMYTRYLAEALSQLDNITVHQINSKQDKSTQSVDLIHYPFFDLFFDTLPIWESVPRVVTIHDVIPLRYPEQYPTGVKASLRLKKQQLALKSVKGIITDSEASKKDIETFLGIDPHLISVIYLAAHETLQTQSDYSVTKLRRELGIPPKYLLYVGDINYNKNIPQLIKALKYLSEDIHLVLVGRNFTPKDIPEWQAIDTQIEMSQVRHRIHLINSILGDSQNQLACLYSGAAAYIQPSLYEGFGLPVLEAMRCETPVIASRTSSLVEIGGDVVNYSEPTAESFAEQCALVLGWSKTKRSKNIKQAKKWGEQFTWKKTAEKTAEVYFKIYNAYH